MVIALRIANLYMPQTVVGSLYSHGKILTNK
jgi:hypothetical protein